jgi:SAM-dependent methyltransferase
MTESIATAYDAVAALYAEKFADAALLDRPLERALLRAFAELVREDGNGEVVDLGCGPGHLTAHLHGLGLDAFGVDASPAMVEIARAAQPELRFELGSMAALGLPDGTLGGALARWSLIHIPPGELPAVVAEIARVLAPGGHLLIALAATDDPAVTTQSYDHSVVTAYRWSADHLAALLREHGLVEQARLVMEPKPEYKRQFQEVQLLARKQA